MLCTARQWASLSS